MLAVTYIFVHVYICIYVYIHIFSRFIFVTSLQADALLGREVCLFFELADFPTLLSGCRRRSREENLSFKSCQIVRNFQIFKIVLDFLEISDFPTLLSGCSREPESRKPFFQILSNCNSPETETLLAQISSTC